MNAQASDTAIAQYQVLERLKLALCSKEVDASRALRRAGFHSSLLKFIPQDACLPRFPRQWQEIALMSATGRAPLCCQKIQPHPLDFDLVTLGIRPAALIHGPVSHLMLLANEARIRGMACAISMIEIAPTTDPKLGDYSNLSKSRQIAHVGSSGWRALLISQDPERMVLSWLAEYANWDSLLGACLGYPHCCIQYFETNWPEATQQHEGDPGIMKLKSARVGQRFDWQMNVFARYTGRVLVDHFPCRFDCPATTAQASVLAQTLEALCPNVLLDMKQRCQATVVWTDKEGVLLLGSRHNKRVLAPVSAQGPIARALRGGDDVAITSSGSLRIGARLVNGRMLHFGLRSRRSTNVGLPEVEAS